MTEVSSSADLRQRSLPLVAHVIHRLGIGGLENGLVNLINHCPAGRYRHAVICMTEAHEFRTRIADSSVPVLEVRKRPGKDWSAYRRVFDTLAALRPDILHTRNLGTLDAVLPARLAGVYRHVHGLHGWDASDLHGTRQRHKLLRRALDPLTQRYIAVSRDLQRWLCDVIGVRSGKVTQIYNGVDSVRFRPTTGRETALVGAPEAPFVFGWVGRFDPVKNPLGLLQAFTALVRRVPAARGRARLALIGSGPLLAAAAALARDGGVADLVWMPGARDDVAELMRDFGAFVLPSLNEGISNTVLEAMASGLPVVATDVGGNRELISSGENGLLVASEDLAALERAMSMVLDDVGLRRRLGMAARAQVESRYSIDSMVAAYLRVYDDLMKK